MSQYVLALDQGTTSSRAIVFDDTARIVAIAQQEFEQIYPAPGHVEHNPEAIWETQLATARAVLTDAGIEPGTWRLWGLPINVRPQWCGNGIPDGRWPMRLCGRAG
ncbi:MAG: hypothetical protein Ct9H300mP1_31340 [Planctomycetaceae bacterium]|nr:MAG: hypothetical protein Ct9H300mP1_31340 [Planctomycetaceae bacterium]